MLRSVAVYSATTGARFISLSRERVREDGSPAPLSTWRTPRWSVQPAAIPAQLTGRQIELVGPAKTHHLLGRRGAPGSSDGMAAQHGADPGQQLTGVERLGQIIIGPISRPTMRSTSSPWR